MTRWTLLVAVFLSACGPLPKPQPPTDYTALWMATCLSEMQAIRHRDITEAELPGCLDVAQAGGDVDAIRAWINALPPEPEPEQPPEQTIVPLTTAGRIFLRDGQPWRIPGQPRVRGRNVACAAGGRDAWGQRRDLVRRLCGSQPPVLGDPRMKEQFQDIAFRSSSLTIIEQADAILMEYQARGFVLTLRQLYYQFVSRDLLKNVQTEYKRLGKIINDARLAGKLDWSGIEDRDRAVTKPNVWSSPESILQAVAQQYKEDPWKTQPYRPEVWIEKNALVGVIEGVCTELRVPFFGCK